MDVAAQLSSALTGRYIIDREIGAGGMATVYLARDVRHDRKVALKVLKPELGAVLGADRFLAEIRVTANLQHPNLLPLFDSGEADGHLFYVMPYVAGESLRHRIDREKQLPVTEALHIATSIAGALDYAHRHGVIHRDLKPENILLHEGQPLVTDFGIALAVSNAGGARITQTGLSLGTPQYMSPEQATGDRAIDGRTDIYSLGAVLYEMLTGDPPHLGSTAQAVIAKVLTDRPRSVRTTRATVPRQVSAAIDRALEKLPADRFTNAHEFSDALTASAPAMISAPTEEVEQPRPQAPRRVTPLSVWLGALAAVASALAVWAWTNRRPLPSNAPPARFVIALPQDVTVDNVYAPLTISHDGQTVVFRASYNNAIRLARRRIDELQVRPIVGTDGAGWPIVSPDSKWVAYLLNGQLRKSPIEGGPSVPVANGEGNGNGMDWSPTDTLVVGAGSSHAFLSVVPASGGTLKQLTQLDSAAGETQQSWPRFLDDGNTIVYVSWPKEGLAGARLAVTSLRSPKTTQVLDIAGTAPLRMVDGHLLYVSAEGVLMAVPFDVKARKTTGAPIALIEGINLNRPVGAARVALSDSGTLVYLTGDAAAQLVTTDLAGAPQTLSASPTNFDGPVWSPDGRRIAVGISTAQGIDIWIYDIASGVLSRVTSDGTNRNPVWSFDGASLVFTSSRSGASAVWSQRVDGSKPPEKLFEAPARAISEATLSPDGHTLVYRTQPENRLYSVDLSGDRTAKLLTTERFAKVHPSFSRDGKWIAYTSIEGATAEVVVRPFPGPGAATQVSVDGGAEPVWGPDSKTVYYRHGRQVIAVSLKMSPTVSVASRRVLFEGLYVSPGLAGHPAMSISPDGKRFVFLRRTDEDSRLIVTTNWFTELRAKIGAKR